MTLSQLKPKIPDTMDPDTMDPDALIKEARRLRRRRWLIGTSLVASLFLASAVTLMMTRHKGGSTITTFGSSSPISIPNTPLAPFPTEPSVRQPPVVGIDVIGPGKLWLVDGYGMFFSSDWGNTWRYTRPPSPGDPIANYSSVSFINSKDGWLIAGIAKGLGVDHTVNGGLSWTSGLLPKVALLGRVSDSLSFANPNDGFVTIEPYSPVGTNTSAILASTNGGSSWSVVKSQVPVGRIKFVSSNIGWGLNPQGTELYLTKDGGASWKEVLLPAGNESQTVFKSLTLPIFFGQTGVLLAQPKSGNALVETTNNSGKTWTPYTTPFQALPTMAPTVLGPICQTCVAVGSEPFVAINSTTFIYLAAGKLYRTANGGQNWISVRTNTISAVVGSLGDHSVAGPLQFSSPNSGWAITTSDNLLLTRDGGAHFSSVIPPCHSFQEQSCASMGLKSTP